MKDQRVEQKELSLDEVFLGSLRYAQLCHGAKHFIGFSGRAWGKFFYFVWEIFKKEGINICVPAVEFKWAGGYPILGAEECRSLRVAMEITAIVNPETRRFRLDTDGDVWGIKLGREFPELAEKIFQQMVLEGNEFISMD